MLSATDQTTESKYWFICYLILVAIGVAAIWFPDHVVMQDYPQHLYMAYVYAATGTIGEYFDTLYTIDLNPGPYSLFYYFIKIISTYVPIEKGCGSFLTTNKSLKNSNLQIFPLES